MTGLSRRDALLGATAAALTTGAIVAPLALKATATRAALAGEPLVALEAQLIEARAVGERAGALWDAAHDKAGSWAFGWPLIDFTTPAMARMRGWYESRSWPERIRTVHLDEIKEFNRYTETLVYGGDEVLAGCKAEGRERIRWWIKARRAQEAAKEGAEMSRFEALLDSNHERVDAIEDRLWDTPAGTMQGVLIRLREAHCDYVRVQILDDPEGDFYSRAFGKVLADLERLAGED